MDLKTYLSESGTTQSDFASQVGVSQGMVWQWLNDVRPIPVDRMPDIEKVTKVKVSRRELHPEWARIWPELAGRAW